MQYASDKWRVTQATTSMEEQPITVRRLISNYRLIRMFVRASFSIQAELNRRLYPENNEPTFSFIVPHRLFVSQMNGNGKKFVLPSLRVQPSGTEGIDYISTSTDYKWRLKNAVPEYIADEDRWITRIEFEGAWNAYLPLGLYEVLYSQVYIAGSSTVPSVPAVSPRSALSGRGKYHWKEVSSAKLEEKDQRAYRRGDIEFVDHFRKIPLIKQYQLIADAKEVSGQDMSNSNWIPRRLSNLNQERTLTLSMSFGADGMAKCSLVTKVDDMTWTRVLTERFTT